MNKMFVVSFRGSFRSGAGRQTDLNALSSSSSAREEMRKTGLFQDSDFAGDLEDSKSTSGGILSIFGSHPFVPIS